MCVCVFVCVCVCMCVYVCVLGCNVLRLFRIIFIYFCTGCDNVVEMISYRVAACMHVSSGLFLRHCIRHCIRVYVKVRNGVKSITFKLWQSITFKLLVCDVC